jgi:hypothetical protein
MDHQTKTDTLAMIAAKASPPVSVSLAHLAGFPVADLVLWATLIYTILMITHKLVQMYRDIWGDK